MESVAGQGRELDDPARYGPLRERILGKPALKLWYEGVYARWAAELGAVPEGGAVVELGSGAGFAKQALPGLIATDALPYPGLDQVADALAMPWPDGGLRALFALNLFHHLGDPAAFLREASRVLKPGGLLLLTDQHPGRLAAPILRWLHHEPFEPRAEGWEAPVAGRLAGANGALAWIVFSRDRARLAAEAPGLSLEAYETFAPLLYWASGGLKAWSLAPSPLLPAWAALDRLLLAAGQDWGSFCHVVLRKRA